MHQSLLLFMIQARVSNDAFVETPGGAYSRKLPSLKLLAKFVGKIRFGLRTSPDPTLNGGLYRE